MTGLCSDETVHLHLDCLIGTGLLRVRDILFDQSLEKHELI